MNELITVNFETNDRPTVLGRDLHSGLNIETPYHKWFPRMCEYGFKDGLDFWTFLSESSGGRPSTDHQITIEMAKEICMIQRTEKGKQYRQYFLRLEKEWNSPQKLMARALQAASKEMKELKEKIASDAPKVLFADAVSTSHSSILVGDLAKILRQNGANIGQNRLFAWMRENGFLIKNGSSQNIPTQKAMDMKLFEVKERALTNPDGTVRVIITTKVTGKGQQYFISRFLGNKEETQLC